VTSGISAGFGRRFGALLYDAFLLAALLIIYTFAALVFTGGHAILRDTAGAWYFVYLAGEIAVIAGYYLLNWTRSGQTLGMRAWHLRAVSDFGKPLSIPSALLRFLCGLLAWPPAGLGVLWLYLDRDRLAIHDRLSKTRIVYLPSGCGKSRPAYKTR
jgi:uncharacterized RDD family membrane protein YckC